MQWIVSQIGAREHYAAPRAFAREGKLEALHTDLWSGRLSGLLGRLPGPFKALGARSHPELSGERVVAYNLSGLAESIAHPLRRRLDASHTILDQYLAIGAAFGERVRRDLQRRGVDAAANAFFSFNTGCLETLEWLSERGVFSIISQIDPGRTEQEMVLAEMRRWPGWSDAAPEVYEPYFARMQAEWAAATRVLVNSEWSRKALVEQGVPERKLVVVPLAYEAPPLEGSPEAPAPGPLRVLWLGQVNLRKGIPYLVEAAKKLPPRDFEFVIAGPLGIRAEAVATAPPNMRFVGRVHRAELAAHYRNSDVFVLPTVSDGFAITQLEAMAHGLPVIATPNCGSVVEPGVDGLIVEARNAEALAAALEWCAANRSALHAMRGPARRKSEMYTLEAYARRVEGAYRDFQSSRA